MSYIDRVRTWRWCFYLNLPIDGFTFLMALLFLHIKSPKRESISTIAQIKRIDPVGIAFFVPSMVCLMLALQWGGSTYPWSASRIIGLLMAFSVLFFAFVFVEIRTPETAMAPTRVILNRSIAGSMTFMFLLSGGLMSVVYYLTIWFQAVKDNSAMHAGVNTIPLVLSLVIMSIFAAIITQNIGYYVPAMLLSPVFCSIGAGLLSTLSPSSGRNAWIGYQVLYGIGIGIGFQTSNLAAQNILPRADVPLGLALMFFMQQLGGSVFLAVSQNIFSSRLVSSLSRIAGLDNEAIVNTGATTLRTIVRLDQLRAIIHAYSHALTRVFVLAAALTACMSLGSLTVEWKKIKGKHEAKECSGSPDNEFDDNKSDAKVQG